MNGIVKYVMINRQLHFDKRLHRPLNDPTIEVLDDSEWPKVPDPEWEAAEAEYEKALPINAIDFVSQKGGKFLVVSDSEKNKGEVSVDGKSIASDTPSTEIENVWMRDVLPNQPRALKTKIL